MNTWSEKTLHLVNEENYLDRLQTIYPHEDSDRDVDEAVLQSIRDSYEAQDNVALLKILLDLEKFPYKDSYVGFLRKDRSAIDRNPKTAERICARLYEMGIEGVIAGATQPKEANARRGQQFTKWTRKNFKWVGVDEFRASTSGVVMLDANELAARDFCNKVMGVGISKRPDMVAKAGSKYVIGEAKFLSSAGGNQGRAFDDGMNLVMNASGSAYKVFILDGVHWIERGSEQFKRIDYSNGAIFSVLLVHEFLDALSKS